MRIFSIPFTSLFGSEMHRVGADQVDVAIFVDVVECGIVVSSKTSESYERCSKDAKSKSSTDVRDGVAIGNAPFY